MMATTDSIHYLRDVTSEMLVEAFELRSRLARWLLQAALAGPTRTIVGSALQVEAMVREQAGKQTASRWLMDYWQVPVTASGASTVPTSGPLLVVANHAGWGDALALWATLPRQDIYTVVKANGLLRAMPNLISHMIVVAENQGMTALRRIIRCLWDGKTVLLFPRGEIEPDPRLNFSGAVDSLQHWTPTVEMIARHVPELRVVPAAVGGVLSASAQKHPIARLYRKPQTREYVGATLQLMLNIYHDVKIDVHIGAPIPAGEVRLPHIQQAMADLLLHYYRARETTT
jgi:1-acyl-sn-glycerol-3-phosphate acyltransferase